MEWEFFTTNRIMLYILNSNVSVEFKKKAHCILKNTDNSTQSSRETVTAPHGVPMYWVSHWICHLARRWREISDAMLF